MFKKKTQPTEDLTKNEIDSKKNIKKKDLKSEDGRQKKPSEGSRFSAIWLLFVTVLISIGFYLWGLMMAKNDQQNTIEPMRSNILYEKL